MELPINQIICGEFTQVAANWPNNSIDLVVTSPPYGNARTYKGYTFNDIEVIKTLYNIIKPGGIVVWVVNDETVAGSETGDSFRQALYFIERGFLLHDTMIYLKNTSSFPARRDGNRYTQIFEFVFIFSKDTKPKTANLICDKENRWKGWVNWGKKTHRNKQGELLETKDIKPVPEFSPRNNVWLYDVGAKYGQKDDIAYEHPATMPLALAIDHIKTWSNEEDIILDGMVGSGTSCVAAKLLGRNYIGVDIAEEYCNISRKRLDLAQKELYEEQIKQKNIKDEENKVLKEEILGKLTSDEREILGFPKQQNKPKIHENITN